MIGRRLILAGGTTSFESLVRPCDRRPTTAGRPAHVSVSEKGLSVGEEGALTHVMHGPINDHH